MMTIEDFTIEYAGEGGFNVTPNTDKAAAFAQQKFGSRRVKGIGMIMLPRQVPEFVEILVREGFTVDEQYGEHGRAPKKIVDSAKR